MDLTDILRCPKTGQSLHFDEAASILRGEDSRVTYPVIGGIVDFCPHAHDRISASYDKTAARYDPGITASTVRAKILGRIIWGRASDRDPMEKVLSLLPDRFDGVLLDDLDRQFKGFTIARKGSDKSVAWLETINRGT